VIASGYAGGGIHLINTRTYATTQVYPATSPRERFDKKTYASCPGPIDPAEKEKFSAHGLAVAPGADRVHRVYLVHHGFRESIEIFEIDTSPAAPTFTWIGCVVAPQTVGLNSVTALPDGGFAATNPNRRGVPAPSPDNTGEVWEWHEKDGWKIVPGSESQGPNGIEVSRDGKTFYVNLWPARKVMRLSRGQTPVVKEFVDVAFQPDNLRWQPDGSLLAAGHGGPNIKRIIECLRKVCPDAASVVARIDPQTLKAQEIIRYPANERFFSSTVALQVGKEIWIGTITGDRIARYPVQ
jgi:sugar lactone lactonase YvrE